MAEGDESGKPAVIGGCCCLILIISGGLVGCSFSTLNYHEIGLDFDSTSQSLNERELFYNGRHFIGLAHSFIKYPTYLHTIEFSDDGSTAAHAHSPPLNCGSKDGQAIIVELSFFMRINTSTIENVVSIYKEYRTSYLSTVTSRAQDAVKGTTVLFETLEFFTNRTEIADAIHDELNEKLASMYMHVEAVQLRDIKLSDNFEDAIIDKIVSAQADKTATEQGLAQQVIADTSVFVQAADTEIAVLTADASSTAVVLTGTAEADASRQRIQADSGALKLLKTELLTHNVEVLQYLWSKTLRDDTSSKLLIGLESNPAIVTA